MIKHFTQFRPQCCSLRFTLFRPGHRHVLSGNVSIKPKMTTIGVQTFVVSHCQPQHGVHSTFVGVPQISLHLFVKPFHTFSLNTGCVTPTGMARMKSGECSTTHTGTGALAAATTTTITTITTTTTTATTVFFAQTQLIGSKTAFYFVPTELDMPSIDITTC